MTTIAAVDISNYDKALSASTVACLKSNGIERVIVRGSLESAAMTALAQQQLQALTDGGIGVDVYLWVYSTDNPTAMVNAAVNAFGDFPVGMWWLDVEDTASWSGVAPATAVAWIGAALARLATLEKSAGIYTAEWCWQPITGNSTEFADDSLWWADYNQAATLDDFVPFGGWTACRGKQYSATGAVCGFSPIDLDVMDAALYAPPVPPTPVPEPVPTPDVPDAQSELNLLDTDIDNYSTALHARVQRAREDLNV